VLCCGIVGQFAMYIGSKVTSHPNLITIYTADHPQKLSTEIVVLLQITHTPAFSFESSDFTFVPYYSRPGENIYYTVRHGDITIAVRIVCVDCVLPYGPRSHMNLVHFIWSILLIIPALTPLLSCHYVPLAIKSYMCVTTKPKSGVRILVLVGRAYGICRKLACCLTSGVKNLIRVNISYV
jgi:hypothetical protein